MTFEEAIAQLTVAGSPFEITEANVLGHTQQVFKNFPAIVPHLFVPARTTGATADRPFLVYEGESISFAEAFAIADALGHALVHTYGVVKGDRVGIAMRNYPNGSSATLRSFRSGRSRFRSTRGGRPTNWPTASKIRPPKF